MHHQPPDPAHPTSGHPTTSPQLATPLHLPRSPLYPTNVLVDHLVLLPTTAGVLNGIVATLLLATSKCRLCESLLRLSGVRIDPADFQRLRLPLWSCFLISSLSSETESVLCQISVGHGIGPDVSQLLDTKVWQIWDDVFYEKGRTKQMLSFQLLVMRGFQFSKLFNKRQIVELFS